MTGRRACGSTTAIRLRLSTTNTPRNRAPPLSRVLFVNKLHTHGFAGMDKDAAWLLIEELAEHSTQDRFVYSHHLRGPSTLAPRRPHAKPTRQ